MKEEGKFFASLIVSRYYRWRVLNIDLRIEAAKEGYLNQDFGIEPIDEEIFAEIGEVKTLQEFAQRYLEIKEKKLNS